MIEHELAPGPGAYVLGTIQGGEVWGEDYPSQIEGTA